MKHSGIFILLGLVVVACTVSATDVPGPREPAVGGNTLSTWVKEYERSIPKPEHEGDPKMRARAESAVRSIGTNALPWLLQELSAKELTRGDELPTNFYSGKAIARRWIAATAFEILGPAGKGATPALVRLLDDKQTSYTAATALGGIGVESIPVLTQALTNSHATARESAVRVLGLLGPKAQSAAPTIIGCTKDPDESVRSFASFALKQIHREAPVQAGAK